MPLPLLRRSRPLLTLLASACALCWLGQADAADSTLEIQQLLAAGHWEQAQQRLAPLRQQAPNDPRWSFDQALALSGAGQTAQAMALYTELTQRYPELPEPYNNLGVLQAQQGQLQAALQSLQEALLANPSYGLARENLGDVEVQLALSDYSAAAGLPGHDGALQDKIQRLRAAQLPAPKAAPMLNTHPNLP